MHLQPHSFWGGESFDSYLYSTSMTHDSRSRHPLSNRTVKAALLGTLMLSAAMLRAQTNPSQPASADTTTLSVRSNLVLVPALVTTKSGEVVFALTADDFVLTDNGVPQRLRMEEDNDAQPIAIVVVMQTGGQGAAHLNDYAGLASVLDAVIGSVPYRIAVVGFDSRPHLDLDFTADKSAAADAVSRLSAGDRGSAILDSLSFGIDLLGKQPPAYRRVLLLFSETIDNGSQSTFQQALRAVDDTNTSIYSFGFSSEKIALEARGLQGASPRWKRLLVASLRARRLHGEGRRSRRAGQSRRSSTGLRQRPAAGPKATPSGLYRRE